MDDDVGESVGDVVGESEGDVVGESDGGEDSRDMSSYGLHDPPNGGKSTCRRSPQLPYFFSTHDQIPSFSPYGLSHEHSTVGPQIKKFHEQPI